MKFYYLPGLICLLIISCTNNNSKDKNPLINNDSINKQKSTLAKIDKNAPKESKIKQRNDTIPFDSIDEKCIELIEKLPEVKEEDKIVDSLSHNNRHVSVFVYEKPDTSSPYYWVKVGEFNEMAFATYFNFIINPKNFEIKYMDSESGNNVSLKEWRKLRKEKPSLH